MSQPQWLTTIRTTQAYMHLCLAADDFSYFDARATLQEKQPNLYRNNFHKMVTDGPHVKAKAMAMKVASGPPAQGNADLKKIADETNKKLQDNVNAATQEVQKLANDAPKNNADVPAWKKKLQDANQKHKDEVTAMMDTATNNAIARIDKLPEAEQAPAADAWTSAYDWIMGAFKTVLEFFQKAWDAVVNAWNAVVAWVDGAIDTIKGWANDAGHAISNAASKIADVFGF